MGSDYQRFDAPHLDYALWECPFDNAVTLRGPAVDRTRPYVVCLGAAPTFGRFCRDPYPALLAGHLGIQVLNAGVAGAGPSTFLGGGWSAWLDGAEAVVVQVLAARSESNSLYDSLPEQAALGIRRSDGQTMRFEAFLGDLLETADPETVRRIVQETRTNYVDNMIRLLDSIRVPKILLWLSKRPARYDIDVGRLHGILNSHPQLVDEAILRLELSRQLVGVAASEIDAGIERLKAQFVGKATTFEEFLARSGRDEPMLREQIALEIGLEKYVRQRLTPEAIEAAYATNRREVDGTRLRVSHVVLRPNILSDDGLERRLKQADGIRRDILQGRMTFEEAARRYSAGPSRHRGGDLGWIGRDGPLIDAFAKPVFAITRGDVSRPFITPYGIHIVKVTEMEAGRVGIGEARPRLEKMLAARLVRELVAEGRRATPVEYAMGVAHFDLATPADGPQPRRVVVDAAAVGN